MTESSIVLGDLASKLDPLRPFVERIATVRYFTKRLFSSILRASFVRSRFKIQIWERVF